MSGWNTVKLETIADVIDSLHQTPRYSQRGYPMVRVTDVKKGSLDLSNTLKVTKELFEKFSKNHTPKKGDIVFSRVGSYGNTSFVNTDDEFCLGQSGCPEFCVNGISLLLWHPVFKLDSKPV